MKLFKLYFLFFLIPIEGLASGPTFDGCTSSNYKSCVAELIHTINTSDRDTQLAAIGHLQELAMTTATLIPFGERKLINNIANYRLEEAFYFPEDKTSFYGCESLGLDYKACERKLVLTINTSDRDTRLVAIGHLQKLAMTTATLIPFGERKRINNIADDFLDEI